MPITPPPIIKRRSKSSSFSRNPSLVNTPGRSAPGMGGQAGTGGHIHIGDFVQVAGRGAVGKTLPPNTKWGGHPLMELDEWMKFYVSLRRFVKSHKAKE